MFVTSFEELLLISAQIKLIKLNFQKYRKL